MKILVPVKRVPDPDTRIRLRADGSGMETEGVTFVINPFDEIAMEEALRLREGGHPVEEIVVVTLGAAESVEQLRRGLAMGADRAIRVDVDGPSEPLAAAKLLRRLVEREQSDLVLMGKQAIDDDCNQTGQMLAALLGWPQATFASRVEVLPSARVGLPSPRVGLRVTREVDGGLETVTVRLPAVVTTDLRLNEPRYVALPGILRAKNKPLEEMSPASLGSALESRTRTLSLAPPPRRSRGTRVADVEELLRRLREEAKVI